MALTTEEILIKIKTEEDGFNKINDEVSQLEAKLNKLASNPRGNVQNFGWFKDQKATLDNAKIAVQQYNTELANKSGANSFTSNSALVSSSISGMVSGFASLYAVQKLWELSLSSKKFEVLKANFEGTEQDIKNFKTATANTVSEGSLIKLSNQATDLGVSLRNQTILFSLAEDAADKYGTSVEEGFNRVIMATEGNIKGLKSLGIQKEVYESIVKDLAKAHGDNINNLDAETQKQIRLEAIIKASGTTFEDATNKIQDSADRQESVWTFLSDLVTKYGWDIVKLTVLPIGALDNLGGALFDLRDNWLKLRDASVDTLKEITGGLIDLRSQAEKPIEVQINVSANVSDLANNWWSVLYGQDLRHVGTTLGANEKRDEQGNIIPFAGTGTKFKPKKGTGNKTAKEEKQEELNLLKIELENLDKLKIKLDANKGEYGAELEIRKQILDIEERIYFLRTGQSPIKFGQPMNGIDPYGELLPRLDPRNFKVQAEGFDIEETTDTIREDFYNMVSSTQSMLQNMGLMETGFGRIVQLIMSILNTVNSGISVIGSIIGIITSFIPGGSVIGSIAGGALGAIGGGGSGRAFGADNIVYNPPTTGNMSFNLGEGTARISGDDLVVVFGRNMSKTNNYLNKTYAT